LTEPFGAFFCVPGGKSSKNGRKNYEKGKFFLKMGGLLTKTGSFLIFGHKKNSLHAAINLPPYLPLFCHNFATFLSKTGWQTL